MTNVFALLGRGALLTAPFRNSSSSLACRQAVPAPRFAASYCWSRSAAAASSSSRRLRTSEPRPGSGYGRRHDAWPSPCRVPPAQNSERPWRLNSMLCARGLAIGLHPSKARSDGQFLFAQLSGPSSQACVSHNALSKPSRAFVRPAKTYRSWPRPIPRIPRFAPESAFGPLHRFGDLCDRCSSFRMRFEFFNIFFRPRTAMRCRFLRRHEQSP